MWKEFKKSFFFLLFHLQKNSNFLFKNLLLKKLNGILNKKTLFENTAKENVCQKISKKSLIIKWNKIRNMGWIDSPKAESKSSFWKQKKKFKLWVLFWNLNGKNSSVKYQVFEWKYILNCMSMILKYGMSYIIVEDNFNSLSMWVMFYFRTCLFST